MEAMRKRRVVLTSIDARHVEHLAGRNERVYEVVGKPLDLDKIVRAVKGVARASHALTMTGGELAATVTL
jgi:hypothetical protein